MLDVVIIITIKKKKKRKQILVRSLRRLLFWARFPLMRKRQIFNNKQVIYSCFKRYQLVISAKKRKKKKRKKRKKKKEKKKKEKKKQKKKLQKEVKSRFRV